MTQDRWIGRQTDRQTNRWMGHSSAPGRGKMTPQPIRCSSFLSTQNYCPSDGMETGGNTATEIHMASPLSDDQLGAAEWSPYTMEKPFLNGRHWRSQCILTSCSGRCSVTDTRIRPPCSPPPHCFIRRWVLMADDGCEGVNCGNDLCLLAL